ncbi:MAG: SCO family protein [Tenuifilaceae bacterium]
MKKLLVIFLFVGYSVVSFSQFTNKVGIDEHLGDTIPLNLTFTNEQNQVVSLGQLINKPTVLSFVYFDCPGICSNYQAGISDLVENSSLVLGKDYDIITISFNYRDNTESALLKKANYVTNIAKDEAASWYYLTGDSTSINKILKSTGYQIKIAGLDYVHPSAIIMLSPQGKITRYLYGLQFLPFDLKMSVIEAQKGISQPTINKVLEFCYAYEPDGKRYSLEITKLAGIFILLLLATLFVVLVLKRKK